MICIGKQCHKLCCGPAPYGDFRGCPAGEHCLRSLALQTSPDGGVISTGADLCYPVNQCDALAPTAGCSAGTSCQIADPTGATACLPEGKGVTADVCRDSNPCKGGYLCVRNGCRRLCRAVPGGGDPSCPPIEGACVHFNTDPPGVGECTPI
jgi:hypothetical protein